METSIAFKESLWVLDWNNSCPISFGCVDTTIMKPLEKPIRI